ncbi:NAD-dependent epimerase/dehydratase family protein [Nonlabens xiamenensis]|uniref:NAD-dependent epimerase/dehydratase family protein n=1 Tax=Nonlabens xiamenensis TaxID=2341043 RepID=UPI000F60620A|nr:NAD-dependent epimerase/dehydratase family protein [Nonlabens xiamenensis]
MKPIGIIIGATGLCGSHLLQQLLSSGDYERVISLSRKRIKKTQDIRPGNGDLQSNQPSLTTPHDNYEVDLFDAETYQEYLKGDHLFICTGTTQAKTPDPEEYYRIEHDLPLTVAQTARSNGVSRLVAISALGADPQSRFSYNRGKGEMERDLESLGFNHCYFVQPALISGNREETRIFESLWKKVQVIIDPLLIGPLRKYRSISPTTIARAMRIVAMKGYNKSRIPSDELKRLAGKESSFK